MVSCRTRFFSSYWHIPGIYQRYHVVAYRNTCWTSHVQDAVPQMALRRLLGCGAMIRLRTNSSSIAEIFIVQIVQGLGSDIIETAIVVAAQIVVPHTELAQVTALITVAAYLGSAIGSAVAGGIYTDTLRGHLEVRLGTTNATEINQMYNSVTGTLPSWGSMERMAVDQAVRMILRSNKNR